ncbi:MAG: DUF2207 domain-containing protein, partial [Atopobiaceae bacterium]|nr:DUF2207 domain-containing protein [Atopobiaceae bacterium]
MEERGLLSGDRGITGKISGTLFAVDFVVFILALADLMLISQRAYEYAGATFSMFVRITLLCTVGIGQLMLLGSLPKRSPEAVEINAKLDALRRWLKDFTKLEEAVPNDVILWNRLLIMAVVLGVSDKVIEQLKLALPAVAWSAAMASSMMWCNRSMGRTSPADAFSSG